MLEAGSPERRCRARGLWPSRARVRLSGHVLMLLGFQGSTREPRSQSVWLYPGCHRGLHAHCPPRCGFSAGLMGTVTSHCGFEAQASRGCWGTTCPFRSWLTFLLSLLICQNPWQDVTFLNFKYQLVVPTCQFGPSFCCSLLCYSSHLPACLL